MLKLQLRLGWRQSLSSPPFTPPRQSSSTPTPAAGPAFHWDWRHHLVHRHRRREPLRRLRRISPGAGALHGDRKTKILRKQDNPAKSKAYSRKQHKIKTIWRVSPGRVRKTSLLYSGLRRVQGNRAARPDSPTHLVSLLAPHPHGIHVFDLETATEALLLPHQGNSPSSPLPRIPPSSPRYSGV